MDDSIKKYFRKYFFQCACLYVICFAMIIFLIVYYKAIWSILLSILLLILCRLLVKYFADKIFLSILIDELDAQKFHNAIYQKIMQPPLLYRLNAEWYMGNYEILINLSASTFHKTKNLTIKCVCLTYLARAYFDIRDIKNLGKTVDSFYELKNDNPKKNNLFSQYKVFNYYKAYINKDFQQCVYLAEEQLNDNSGANSKQKMRLLTGRCNCAIAYYETGDYNKAKEIFEYFIKTTPNLRNFTTLSQLYIDAIDNKDPSCLACSICIKDTKEQEMIDIKKGKIKGILIGIIGVFIIVFFVWTQFVSRVSYEDKLKNALYKQYNQVQLIKYFDIEKEKEYIDTFCIIDTEDGLKLVSIVNNDNALETVFLYEGIDTDMYYYVKSAVSDYYIGFTFNYSPSEATNIYHEIDFVYDGVKYWISIDYIETYI